MAASDIFSLKLNCPHCRQAGFVAWEGQAQSPPRIVFLSRGFHPERTSGDASPLIVCDVCDEIQDGITGGIVH